ncbi:MAG TPA: pantoate--beta-alanine ligase [Alphaproteobacteria bacterium]|nr:pantoate--beta-alanine ligase [Alphaproteobacteria bacterium]
MPDGADGPLEIVRTKAGLRARLAVWRDCGMSVGLAPTMGALHAGHMALVRRSIAECERTVVSVFVNPAQFGPGEDLDAYPRDEARDRDMLAAAGAHVLYAPSAPEVYPEGFATTVSVAAPGDVLEGQCRPGFFDGVATVLAKLFAQCRPDKAFFGEKDYQQLLVVRRLAGDLDLGVEVVGVETVRERDGLAASSRNVYLTAAERKSAPALYRTIRALAKRAAAGENVSDEEKIAADMLLEAGFDGVDYVTVRDAATLAPYRGRETPGRVLAAATIGRTRLIDNVPVALRRSS